MADSSWLDYAVPIAAAGVSAAFPRYGRPAVGIGLTTYDLLQRQKEIQRYNDMMAQQREDAAAGSADLQKAIYGAAGIETGEPQLHPASGTAVVRPLPGLPTGRRYSDLMGSAARNANAATENDMPGHPIDARTAETAASLVRSSDTVGARELVIRELEKRGEPTYAEAMGLAAPPPGASVQAVTREGFSVTRATPAPTQRSETREELFRRDPRAFNAMVAAEENARAKANAANRQPAMEWQLGQPTEDPDTGELVYPTYNRVTNRPGEPVRIKGRKPKAGGGGNEKKPGKGSVLAGILGEQDKNLGDDLGPSREKDGATATNKTTGQKIITKDGRWRVLLASRKGSN